MSNLDKRKIMNIFIFANCHGQIYKKFILENVLDRKQVNVDYAISYESLDSYNELLPTFQEADILIIQPVSNYKEFMLTNLVKVLKPDCLIIKVPFVRFEGFWPKETAKKLTKFDHAAVTDFPKLNSNEEIITYLTEEKTDTKYIKAVFELGLSKLKDIEDSGDIEFFDFFLEHYQTVPLFRDQLHPTTIFYKHFAKQIVEIISKKKNVKFSNSKDSVRENVEKEYGHYRPIKDIFAKTLGLEYDLSGYFVYNRFEYLSNVLHYENSANTKDRVADINMLKNLVFNKMDLKKNTEQVKNPYIGLPTKSFWKLAVADKSMFDIQDLWDPKFKVQQGQNVATYGSCFAQHIGQALKARGFNWLMSESQPYQCSEGLAKKYGYNTFSSRTGNIYTTSLLKQWTEWSLGTKSVPNEVWIKDGRFYDPFRPRIEPNGFISEDELTQSRLETIKYFRKSIEDSQYFVFTLGLTESWFNIKGFEYPMCPGTVAGDYDPLQHRFVNQNYQQISDNLSEAMTMMREINSKLKFILTVSPVPLTATKSGKHVAVATMASKSVLRAVTDQLVGALDYVDYFPSYEIINSPIFKGTFFEPNQRSVNPYGVNFVMDNFFKCLVKKFGRFEQSSQSSLLKGATISTQNTLEQATCEEELLGAFGTSK
jgi:hypothetical protein